MSTSGTKEPHLGSKDTLETLSSGKDGTDRYRILHDLGQYIVPTVPGSILEIGVGESSYYLTKLAEKFKRRIYHCDISASKILNPMSVPGYLSNSEEITYFEERDPNPKSYKRCVCFAGPSDELFKRVPIEPVAMAFIDGDHNFIQAEKDFENVWKLLNEDGYIFLHDTHPPNKDFLDENHCGDVYLLRRDLAMKWDRLDSFTFSKGCCLGVGLTMVRKKVKGRPYFQM